LHIVTLGAFAISIGGAHIGTPRWDRRRSLCGALLLGKRRGTHAGYQRWLDDAETALARLEALRESIAHDQELRW
jgi:hypothetical protein